MGIISAKNILHTSIPSKNGLLIGRRLRGVMDQNATDKYKAMLNQAVLETGNADFGWFKLD